MVACFAAPAIAGIEQGQHALTARCPGWEVRRNHRQSEQIPSTHKWALQIRKQAEHETSLGERGSTRQIAPSEASSGAVICSCRSMRIETGTCDLANSYSSRSDLDKLSPNRGVCVVKFVSPGVTRIAMYIYKHTAYVISKSSAGQNGYPSDSAGITHFGGNDCAAGSRTSIDQLFHSGDRRPTRQNGAFRTIRRRT